MIDVALDHLRILVAADSSNPPRAITRDHVAVQHASEVLRGAGFIVEVNDLGDGCVNLLAVRGAPDVLFNCARHLCLRRSGSPNPIYANKGDGHG